MLNLETDHLYLRRLDSSDQSDFEILLQDKDVMEFSGGTKSAEQVAQWITDQQKQYDENGYGLLAVVHKDSANVIGYCGLTRFDNINGNREIELGYRILKEYWGSGYATEAAAVVKASSFKQLNIEKLISIVSPKNTRSIRVAEKLGMSLVDTVMLPGYSYPDNVYAVHKTSSA